MEKREPIEAGRVQPTYAGFVILRLNEIWGVWAEGDSVKALTLALRFADTLTPRKIKKELQDDVKGIRLELNKVYKMKFGSDWYTQQLKRNEEVRKIADRYAGPFLSELSDYLDEAGYYERAATRLKTKDLREFEEEEE